MKGGDPMSTPLRDVSLNDIWAELDRRFDAVVLVYCYRNEPTADKDDEKEQFRVHSSSSFTACSGLLKRANSMFDRIDWQYLPGAVIVEDDEDDEDDEQETGAPAE